MSDKTRFIMLFVTACVIAFSFQGSRGLFESTEGRYAECAREMMETGNWVVPQLDYHPHWTKPPLTYWAIAGGMKLLGQNGWGVRLYSAIGFILLTCAITALGTVLWNRRCGLLAGMIYVSSPFTIGAAYSVNTDVLLSTWIMLAALAYWKASSFEQPLQRRWIHLFWLFMGLGFLTKGPPALLILPVIFIYHIYLRKTGRRYPSLLSWPGITVFIFLGLGWYLWVVIRYPGLLSYLFKDEIVGRVATNEFHRNSQWYYPITTYLPLMLSALLPWAILWPSGSLTRLCNVLKTSQWRTWLTERHRVVFLLLWAGVPFGVFSISSSRMPLYLLPYFAAVVLALARSIERLGSDEVVLQKAARIAAVMLVIMLGVKIGMTYVPSKKNMEDLYKYCRAYEKQDAGFYALDCGKMYGLQFYLKGKLTRIGFSDNDPDADLSISNLMQEIKQNPQHQTYLLVTRVSKTELTSKKLNENNFSYQTNPTDNNYILFAVLPSKSSDELTTER